MQSVVWRCRTWEAVSTTVQVSTITHWESINFIIYLHAACNIADCNKVYSLCNNVSSESSPQEPSRIQHIVSSSKQLVNCTFVVVNTMISVTCQKGDYQLTFKNTTTACTRDLGINCNQGKQVSQTQLLSLKLFGTDNPVGTCIRTYHFCQPNTCQPLREIVHTTILNQCTKSVTTETHTKEITVTTYSPTLFYTPVQVTVCPSTTSSLLSQTKETVNVTASMASSTNIYHPSTTCSPTSEIHVPTLTVPLTIAAPTTGALVVLLIVVTIGWVCTCRIMKKRGKMEINIMQDRYCIIY